MGLRYDNPPLVEALCELRFASNEAAKWDWAVPGLLYPRIANRFPKRGERTNLEIKPGSPPQPRIYFQMLADDERSFVQVSRDLLAVNSLPPHLGWPDVRDSLLWVLGAYREIAQPAVITMAALRYINRVEIPLSPGLALEDYFAVRPALPEGVPQAITKFTMQTEVTYEDPAALFRFRFGSTDSLPEVGAFLLDYEHVAAEADAPSFDSLLAWLDTAHERIEHAFYGSCTAKTHAEIFKERRS